MKKSLYIEVTFIRILAVVAQLFFLKFYTHYISAFNLGIYVLLNTISYSLNAFVFVPLDFFQQSNLYKLKTNQESIKSYLTINKLIFKYLAIVVAIALVICFFIKPDFIIYIPFVVLYATSLYLVTSIRGMINNLEKRRAAIYCILIEIVARVLFFYFFIHFFQPNGLVLFGATLSASLSILIVLFFIFRNLSEYKFDKIYHFENGKILRFCYPISVSAVINWIQIQGYSLVLGPLGLVEIVGIYGTVSGVGAAGMGAGCSVYSQIFTPNIYKSHGAYIKTYCKNALLLIGVVLIGGLAFSKLFIPLMTKPEFGKYAYIMGYGILIEGGSLLIGALTSFLTINNMTKATLKASILNLVCFVSMFVFIYLLKLINIYSIGLPIVISQFAVTFYLYLMVSKILKTN